MGELRQSCPKRVGNQAARQRFVQAGGNIFHDGMFAPVKDEAEIMTYVPSPRTAIGTTERLADCLQCLSSILSTHDPAGISKNIESELISAAVEAGWEEDEIRTALANFRSSDAVARDQTEKPVPFPDLAQVSSSDQLESKANSQGDESAEGFQERAENEERRIERQKGSPLEKGQDRFEERSRSSDGQSAGDKQVP